MTKDDIIKTVAKHSHRPKSKIAATLNQFLFEVSNAMVRKERVEIRRFGTFEVKYQKARVARNLNTNERIELPPRGMPRFVPFSAFKDRVSAGCAIEGGVKSREKKEAPSLNREPGRPLPVPQEKPWRGDSQTSSKDELPTLRKAVEDDPDNTENRLALAEACVIRGDIMGALEQTRYVLRKNAKNTHAINLQGLAHERQGIDELALQEFERALQVDADDVETLLNIGSLRSKLGQYNEAEMNFKRVLELDSQQMDANFNLGVIHTRRGLYGRAIQDFERVIDLNPSNIEAYFNLGKAYDHLERYDDAINMFEKLLNVQPENDRAFWHLGTLHDKKKDGAKALEMYQHSNRLLTAAKKERH